MATSNMRSYDDAIKTLTADAQNVALGGKMKEEGEYGFFRHIVELSAEGAFDTHKPPVDGKALFAIFEASAPGANKGQKQSEFSAALRMGKSHLDQGYIETLLDVDLVAARANVPKDSKPESRLRSAYRAAVKINEIAADSVKKSLTQDEINACCIRGGGETKTPEQKMATLLKSAEALIKGTDTEPAVLKSAEFEKALGEMNAALKAWTARSVKAQVAAALTDEDLARLGLSRVTPPTLTIVPTAAPVKKTRNGKKAA